MKIIPLLLMMMLVVVPCSANTDIYSVQFADANGVFTGNTDIAKCVICVPGDEKNIVTTLLVDLNYKTSKIIDVNGKPNVSKEHSGWVEMNNEMFNDITGYINANYKSILKDSFNNHQSAYRVN